MDINNQCRLCLQYNAENISMFDQQNPTPNVVDKLTMLFGSEFIKEDHPEHIFPKKICPKCKEQVSECFQFCTVVLNNHKNLIQIYEDQQEPPASTCPLNYEISCLTPTNIYTDVQSDILQTADIQILETSPFVTPPLDVNVQNGPDPVLLVPHHDLQLCQATLSNNIIIIPALQLGINSLEGIQCQEAVLPKDNIFIEAVCPGSSEGNPIETEDPSSVEDISTETEDPGSVEDISIEAENPGSVEDISIEAENPGSVEDISIEAVISDSVEDNSIEAEDHDCVEDSTKAVDPDNVVDKLIPESTTKAQSSEILYKKNEKVRRQLDKHMPDHLKTRMTKELGDAKIKEFAQLYCELCDHRPILETFKELQTHYYSIHNTKGYARCCDKKIFRKDRLMSHIMTHIDPNAFKCSMCGHACKSKTLLRTHMKQHLPVEERSFQCTTCGQRFVLRSQLTNHKASHFTHDQKKYVCQDCGKAFSRKFVLVKHQTTHLSQKNFVCEICANLFTSQSNLKAHMLCHNEAAQIRSQCTICGKWYKSIHTMRKHMRRHRDTHRYVCNTCGKECTTQGSLAAHIKYVHLRVNQFKCSVCTKQFRRKLEFTEHMARHTGEILYNCEFCSKTFMSSSNYFTHRKKRHALELLIASNKAKENMTLKESSQ